MVMLTKYPDVLRSDMQHYYGLDIDELGYSLRIRRAADLAANLPHGAQVWGMIDPRAQWTTTDYLLANIADATAFNAWTKTKDSKHGRWRGAIPRPGQQDERKQTMTTGAAANVDELRRLLNIPADTPL